MQNFYTLSAAIEGNSYTKVDKQNETYSGINVRLRYFVRLVVLRSYAVNIFKEVDMVVQNVYPPPDLNNNIKMEALGTGTPLGTIGHLMLR
ncbi:unnamed protein product [Cladocopium goreaui]|uniref:Vacuolar protein sorting-associated protein 26 n=1 Tax=Cladocopium goreaui TaxID=2562237 RepID=A0A9P1GBR0_9DINO|nr:unnamed protein product [Cladocopium goreaui]